MSVQKNSGNTVTVVSTWIIALGITLLAVCLIISINGITLPLVAGITIGWFFGLVGVVALTVNNYLDRRETTRSLLNQK